MLNKSNEQSKFGTFEYIYVKNYLIRLNGYFIV